MTLSPIQPSIDQEENQPCSLHIAKIISTYTLIQYHTYYVNTEDLPTSLQPEADILGHYIHTTDYCSRLLQCIDAVARLNLVKEAYKEYQTEKEKWKHFSSQ